MKIPIAVVLSLGAAVSMAQTTSSSGTTGTQKATMPRIVLPPDQPTKAGGAGKSGTTSETNSAKQADTATGKTSAPAKAGAKKDEKPGKIEGIEIPRGEGFLGIQIVDSTFKLTFYDAKKKPVAADVDRAALRWDPKYKVGEERVVLTRSDDGKSLSSPKNIRPPYNFKLFITLIRDAAEGRPPLNETFTVDFRQ